MVIRYEIHRIQPKNGFVAMVCEIDMQTNHVSTWLYTGDELRALLSRTGKLTVRKGSDWIAQYQQPAHHSLDAWFGAAA